MLRGSLDFVRAILITFLFEVFLEEAMPVLERQSREQVDLAYQNTSSQPRKSSDILDSVLLRKLCLWLSNAILQFPVMFEIQQKSLSQPTLLRREVEADLQELMRSHNGEFLILDYGCGSGTYSGLCNPANYLGIDCNKGMLERAGAINPGHSFIHAANLDGIGNTLNSVVHILMIGVIHHLSAEDLVEILSAVPKHKKVKLLAIDTLKSSNFLGRAIQLFERGEFLRDEREHLALLDTVAETTSYKRVPYGKFFELAVYRGTLR